MNPQVSIDRTLTLQSYFIAVGSVSEPGLHQHLLDSSRRMWSIHQPTKCSNRWFHFTGIRLRSNKTVTWHPVPDMLHQAYTIQPNQPSARQGQRQPRQSERNGQKEQRRKRDEASNQDSADIEQRHWQEWSFHR